MSFMFKDKQGYYDPTTEGYYTEGEKVLKSAPIDLSGNFKTPPEKKFVRKNRVVKKRRETPHSTAGRLEDFTLNPRGREVYKPSIKKTSEVKAGKSPMKKPWQPGWGTVAAAAGLSALAGWGLSKARSGSKRPTNQHYGPKYIRNYYYR